MKVAIIGSNNNAAHFLKECEIINNIEEADVVIFDGNINWRSAGLKFSKLTNKQLVVSFNTCADFIAKKYNISIINAMNRRDDRTQDIINNQTGYVYQGLVNINRVYYPTDFKTGKTYFVGEANDFRIGFSKQEQVDYLNDVGGVPLVTLFKGSNKPQFLLIQVNINKFPNVHICNCLNELVCESLNTL